MRDFEVYPRKGKVNPLRRWYLYRNPFRVGLNFLVIYSCRYLPSLALKNFLYRIIGIRLGKNVSVGLGVVFDIFFPELIEVGDNSVLGYDSTILVHEFLVDELRKGKVRIGSNVLVGARALVLPGVSIGDDAKVSALSLVNCDIPSGSFFGGVPARRLKNDR